MVAVAALSCLSGIEQSVAAQSAAPELGEDSRHAGPLQTYVAKPDSTYEWHVRGRYRYHGTELVELELLSQTWQDVVWKHQLILIKPPHVADPARGVLIIGGGHWHDSYETDPAPDSLPKGGGAFVLIARRLESVVAVLGQVPFQPLFGKDEDELIAYTLTKRL
jgi:PhoPQ-activated pathogenicity-related protein